MLTAKKRISLIFLFIHLNFAIFEIAILVMGKMADEIKRATEQGDKLSATGLSGAVRSVEDNSFTVGDKWKFPTEPQVYARVMGKDAQGKPIISKYIFVEMLDGAQKGNAKQFHFGTFTKLRFVYNEPQGELPPESTGVRKYTQGSAAKAFQSKGSLEEAYAQVAGKTVKITSQERIRTLRFGTLSLMDTYIPTIDFADDTASQPVDTIAETQEA
jgi:hypothetical protein